MSSPQPSVVCEGCGATVPDISGPTHAYMTSAPGCWAVHGDLVALGISATAPGGSSQLRTDAYAAQHATNPDPRNRQSVAVHLMSLCATYELGMAPGRTTHLLGGWTHRPGGYPDFISDQRHGALTVVDALAAAGVLGYETAVDQWARSVWAGWEAIHTTIRALLGEQGLD